jgi:acetyl-CoA synthetase
MTASIESTSHEDRQFEPVARVRDRAYVKSRAEYDALYHESIQNPEAFWRKISNDFVWDRPWTKLCNYDFKDQIKIEWFSDGQTNLSVNCLDRHIDAGRGKDVAFLWEGNDVSEKRTVTYAELFCDTCRFANVLKANGVKKGDRVTLYMPMIPEAAVAMLACARIGAIHSVIFGGFAAHAIRDRLVDCQSEFVVTADGTYRGSKYIPLKPVVDEAILGAAEVGVKVKRCIVYRRTGDAVAMTEGRDLWWHDAIETASAECDAVPMNAEDPLFVLYTSGSTGKPKGVLHTTAGYMVWAATTFKYVFDYHPGDIWWCTADVGWVTGHSYAVYGPLCNGATSVMFEGIPTYPDAGRFWEMCERYRVTQFYTAPTAIRALMREGEQWPQKYDLSSLRILGTVGEPINPEAWMWYHTNIGRGDCPIVDTWWQTETGGILISPLPGAFATKPGSATLPFFGVEPCVVTEKGETCQANEGGLLVLTKPWPGIMRSVYGQHDRFKETYFSRFPGWYFTGDGARVDDDGYYWLMGRVDDVINVSGHRIGTAEVESALVSDTRVAEAAVVGMPHEIKGQGLYAYVTLKAGQVASEDLRKQLVIHVRNEIGPIAAPDKIQFADALPKTRSGKIMRRILRKIAEGHTSPEDLGDVTTLADPAVVQQLLSTK